MQSAINSSYKLSEEINECLRGISIPGDEASLFSCLFHNIVIEHQRSITVLIEQKLYGSACALVRCLFEAHFKGMWFYECAKEVHFERLREDKFEKPFGQIISELEVIKGPSIAKPKKNYWKSLNSLTHSGPAQLKRRVRDNEIRSNYPENFLKETLVFSESYALISCGELAKISDNRDSQSRFIDIAKQRNYSLLQTHTH